MRPRLLLVPTLTLGLLAACGNPSPEGNHNEGTCLGKCDDAQRGQLIAKLEGHDNYIATYLRDSLDEQGRLFGDYRDFLDGIAQTMDCPPEQESTFVILMSRKSYFPRNIVTHCSKDPRRASEFFLSTQSDDGELADIDPTDFKMIAWDRPANAYRFYEAKRRSDGYLDVKVEPRACLGCHGGNPELDTSDLAFTPIMNELTQPWTLWNAEPGFRSHHFDDFLSPELESATVYNDMIQGDRLASASDLEQIARFSFSRVSNARLLSRREAPSVDAGFDLLRPMFCEETLNFASEDHGTDSITLSAIVDESISQLYLKHRAYDWPFDFINDQRFRLPNLVDGEERINVIPTRGEATLQVEQGLVGRRVFTAIDILRIRSLDWQKPVFSEFRCQLWRDAEQRMILEPPSLDGLETLADLLPTLYREIMTLHREDGSTISLIPEGELTLYSLPNADDEDIQQAIQGNDLSSLQHDLDSFAEQVEAYMESFEAEGARLRLEQERQRRGCRALANLPTSPDIPGVEACP